MARKAVLKRIKITKSGKLLHRHSGQNHFNAKMSRKTQLRTGGMMKFTKTTNKKIKQYI